MDQPNSDRTAKDQAAIESQMHHWAAIDQGVPGRDPTPAEQAKFINGYSWGALAYGYLYFRAMQDPFMAWISLIGGILFFPIALILPIWARPRAQEQRRWFTFNHFKEVQGKWDKAAVYGIVIFAIGSYLLYRVSVGFLQSIIKTVDPSLLNSRSINPDQLQQIQENLNDAIGN